MEGLQLLDECCGKPDSCTAMCPQNPGMFIARWREINGFELTKVPGANPVPPVALRPMPRTSTMARPRWCCWS